MVHNFENQRCIFLVVTAVMCTVDGKNNVYTRFMRYLRAQMAVGAVLWTQAMPTEYFPEV